MGMGRREKQRRQEELWIAHTELPRTVAHPFYEQVNRVLEARGFDEWVEQQCTRFYAERMGRPSLAPGRYFRLLLIGYFEGIDSERGMAWRAADSLALRSFLGVGLNEMPADHSTISRTRRLIDVETHQAVFRWVLELLAEKDLLKGKTIGLDATTLEANAALTLDCAARYRGRLSGVSGTAGAGIGDRDADPGAVGQAGPDACTEGIE
jgi:transposase